MTLFFRDAPLWRSAFAVFSFMWGMSSLYDDVAAAWGSRAFVRLLIQVLIGYAGALALAGLFRARSRSQPTVPAPPAV